MNQVPVQMWLINPGFKSQIREIHKIGTQQYSTVAMQGLFSTALVPQRSFLKSKKEKKEEQNARTQKLI